MSFFGLFGDDRQLAAQYAARGRESATARRRRKDAEREQQQAAARRRGHHRHAAQADRAGQRWERDDRRLFGG